MNYETIKWQDEARSVARAFGVKCECYFAPDENEHVLRHDETGWLPGNDETWVSVRYKASHRDFMLVKERKTIGIEISYDADPAGTRIYAGVSKTDNLELQIYLTRTLFYLDLLTPQLEAALQLSISHHQKLEWAMEFENR